MKKNLIVTVLSAGALIIGAQSAAALVGLNPMAEATATALPTITFPWQGQAPSGTACPVPPPAADAPTSDARPTLEVRSGDARIPGCRPPHGHRKGPHHLSGDVRSGDARPSFDVRSGDARPHGKPIFASGDARPLPPFSTDVRPSGDVRGPGFGPGRGHGHGGPGAGRPGGFGHGNGGPGDDANGGFVPAAPAPAPAISASASPTPVTGASVTFGNQNRQGGPRPFGRPRGNH